MKTSVITVCRNSASTIEDALRSVASQSYPDIEHIVVDGASTDGTLDIVDRYRGRLAKVMSEPDRGIYDAMNKGVAVAGGEVICFLNSDDIYANNTVISKVVNYLEQNNLDAVYGDVEFFKSETPEVTLRRYRSNRFRPDRIGWGWMPAHPALFVRRRIFDQYGGFRIHYRIAGDFEFVARIFHRNALRYCYLPEVLVRMRLKGISTAGWRNTWLLNREVLQACRENGIPTNIFKILSKYPAKMLEYLQA
ncbi:MAG TPA: glycosyltransferase family 2 protein [Xanthobacteraceae bacterium]|nr:glycosyltransferase family 2 protein [Xanthobacteraceae bacterium]